MTYPLEGIRVLDLTRALSGPYATRMLSDLGADVVKVEPPVGDITRAYGSRIGNLSSHYTQHNVGKRNICVDLAAEGAAQLILELAAVADVLIENFRPGVMERQGLGWSTLHEANPKLIMLSISGFGQDGPERDRAAYAPVLHAETGLISRFAELHGRTPVDFPLSIADTTAAVHGVIGVLSAIVMTQRTGVGQHIDLSMINAQFYHDDFLSMVINGDRPTAGSGDIYDVVGGQILIATPLHYLWRMLAAKHGLEDPGDDEGRRSTLAAFLAGQPSWDAVTALLDDVNLAWGRVRHWQDAVTSSPSTGPRRILTEVDDRVGGTRLTTQAPYQFSDAECGVRGPAPYRGEHNAEVLQDWLGRTASEVSLLADSGVLTQQERPA